MVINTASEAAETLALALADYLNHPFWGRRGSVSDKEALQEAALGIEEEHLLSYLRFGHIPVFLSSKIERQEVSPELTASILREDRLAHGTTGMVLGLQQAAAGLLSAPSSTRQLLLEGPRPERTEAEDASHEPKPYIPELAPDAGYRIGADGLIDDFLQSLSKTGATLERLEIPRNLFQNVQLALSRPNERTSGGMDELTDLLRFYHYLGSVRRLQKAWRPFLREVELSSLAREFQLKEESIVSGLFVWRVLQPFFGQQESNATLLNHLRSLGKSQNALFSFIAEFQKRFASAEVTSREVTRAARETHHAAVLAEVEDRQTERRAQEREAVQRRFADLGFRLPEAGTVGSPIAGGPADDPALSNAPTLEGFVYRLARMDLEDETVRRLNVDRAFAQETMGRLVGGEKEGETSFRSGRAAILRPLHSDRADDPLRLFVAGEVDGEPLAAALFSFLDGFQGFPTGRWWRENTIGTRLKSFQTALPDFTTARLEVAAAEKQALNQRVVSLETVIGEILKRLEKLEKGSAVEGAGLEEQEPKIRFIVDTHQVGEKEGDPRVLRLAELAVHLMRKGLPIEMAGVATAEELAGAQAEIADPSVRRTLGDFTYLYLPGDAESHARALAQARLLVPVPTPELIITEMSPSTLGWFLEALQFLGVKNLAVC